jgi:tetratricopeptide (TPR) repeat protein
MRFRIGPSAPAAVLALVLGSAACTQREPAAPVPARPYAGESLTTVLAHADTAFREGDHDEAVPAYEEALRRDPENSRATANLGTSYLLGRQVLKARELVEGFLVRHPEDVPNRLVLARILLRQAELEPAAAALAAVLKTQPDLLMARYNLGFISYRLRRYQEAEGHLKRATDLRPDFPEAFYTLGLTYLALGRLDAGIEALEKTVALDPRHIGARFNLAGAYARAGRMAESQRHQAAFADLSGRSKAQQERETQIKASSVEALRHVQERRLPEALAAYEKLAGQFPDHAGILLEVGRLRHQLGRHDEALVALRRAVELDSRLSQPHYLMAEIHRERGDAVAARRELDLFATLEAIPEGKSGY